MNGFCKRWKERGDRTWFKSTIADWRHFGLPVDEERRLCYVGVTRAKRRLTLALALQRMKWGKARPTVPSRFLYELTGQTGNPNYWRAIASEPPKAGEK